MECGYKIYEIREIHEIHYTTVFEFSKRNVYARAAPIFCNSIDLMDLMDFFGEFKSIQNPWDFDL